MRAGKELNVLIAEHIMGLPYFHAKDNSVEKDELRIYHKDIVDGHYEGTFWKNEYKTISETWPMDMKLPKGYSYNLDAAWEVVEKMRENDYNLQLFSHNTEMFTGYHVFFSYNPKDNPLSITDCKPAEASTAAVAICLAALNAKGIDYVDDVVSTSING